VRASGIASDWLRIGGGAFTVAIVSSCFSTVVAPVLSAVEPQRRAAHPFELTEVEGRLGEPELSLLRLVEPDDETSLVARLTELLRGMGFVHPVVTVLPNGAGETWMRVRIEAGPRLRLGQVTVTGAPEVSPDQLVAVRTRVREMLKNCQLHVARTAGRRAEPVK
jgi:hypothetical protein